MVSQLSAKDDVLNWQLRINISKAWTMVAPSNTGLNSANLTVTSDADAKHFTGIAQRMAWRALTMLSSPPMVMESGLTSCRDIPPMMCIGEDGDAATVAVAAA
eukprot:7816261-Ditylum_brightwellii.AAC.1